MYTAKEKKNRVQFCYCVFPIVTDTYNVGTVGNVVRLRYEDKNTPDKY